MNKILFTKKGADVDWIHAWGPVVYYCYLGYVPPGQFGVMWHPTKFFAVEWETREDETAPNIAHVSCYNFADEEGAAYVETLSYNWEEGERPQWALAE